MPSERSEIQDAGKPPPGPKPPAGRLKSFSLIFVQLLLVVAVVYLWEVEERRQLFSLMCVVAAGFAVHVWLPPAHRPAFFALLSMGTILFILGLINGTWVLGIGAGLIAITYLPVRFACRVTLLALITSGLVYFRRHDPSLGFWSVLGSMFMFRLIVYLYDTRNARERQPLADSLSYFFLLPNACFPLFPVVDYRTFRECYSSRDEWSGYQRGLTWIVRGISHLLLYRYIKFYLVPAPYELTDFAHAALFMATNYALYLRVSGQFHLITGILHLFGFNLPRTHLFFFLASSCSDIWRRINIYWKDFMMKLFFFPTFFAFRNRGAPTAAASAIAILWVFVCTWLLHSWQMFWLRGEFPLSRSAAALWLSAGILVAINSWIEYRRTTRRTRRKERSFFFQASVRSLQTIAMFAVVSLFWACWTRPGFEETLWDLLQIAPAGSYELWSGFAALAAFVAVGVAVQWVARAYPSGRFELDSLTLDASLKFNGIILSALVVVALPGFGRMFGARVEEALAEFRSDSLTPLEIADQMHGYYEDLNDAVTQAGPFLSSLELDKQEGQPKTEYKSLVRRADPILDAELIPGVQGALEGSWVSINQFGMRDRDSITLRKPVNTTRIALVGSSVVMGFSVNDEEAFGRVLEARLNSGRAATASHFELLNFGIADSSSFRRMALIDRKVLPFEPDAIYYFVHQDELTRPVEHIARFVSQGHEIPYPALREIVARTGADSDMAPGSIVVRLRLHSERILRATYRHTVGTCQTRDILPVWIYLPIPGVSDAPDDLDVIRNAAHDAGFVVLELTDWWQGHALTKVKRNPGDHHPNALGHRLIADRLYDVLQQQGEALPSS